MAEEVGRGAPVERPLLLQPTAVGMVDDELGVRFHDPLRLALAPSTTPVATATFFTPRAERLAALGILATWRLSNLVASSSYVERPYRSSTKSGGADPDDALARVVRAFAKSGWS